MRLRFCRYGPKSRAAKTAYCYSMMFANNFVCIWQHTNHTNSMSWQWPRVPVVQEKRHGWFSPQPRCIIPVMPRCSVCRLSMFVFILPCVPDGGLFTVYLFLSKICPCSTGDDKQWKGIVYVSIVCIFDTYSYRLSILVTYRFHVDCLVGLIIYTCVKSLTICSSLFV